MASLPPGASDPAQLLDQQPVAFQECLQRGRAGEASRVVGVELLPPVGRMDPAELEALAGELRGIAGIWPLVEIAGVAVDAQFLAHIAAGAAAGHGIEDTERFEVAQQVFDEVAAAVAGIAAVAVVAGSAKWYRLVRCGTGLALIGARGSLA